MVGIDLPSQYDGLFRASSVAQNPGNLGKGQQWVKASFIDNADDLTTATTDKAEGGMKRQFIRAKLEDSPSMDDRHPIMRTGQHRNAALLRQCVQ